MLAASLRQPVRGRRRRAPQHRSQEQVAMVRAAAAAAAETRGDGPAGARPVARGPGRRGRGLEVRRGRAAPSCRRLRAATSRRATRPLLRLGLEWGVGKARYEVHPRFPVLGRVCLDLLGLMGAGTRQAGSVRGDWAAAWRQPSVTAPRGARAAALFWARVWSSP